MNEGPAHERRPATLYDALAQRPDVDPNDPPGPGTDITMTTETMDNDTATGSLHVVALGR